MLTVGYIGLGLMASRLPAYSQGGLPAGGTQPLTCRGEELVAEGASAAGSPAEVAAQVDIAFTNLPDTPDVEKVVLGGKGILEGAHPGLIFVDNSTIKPAVARSLAASLAERGVLSLDAPVSGGDIGARNGTLAIMVGGPAEALEQVRPVFQAMGKTITHVGEAGAGQWPRLPTRSWCGADGGDGELLIFSQKAGWTRRKWWKPSRAARRSAGPWMSNRPGCLPATVRRASRRTLQAKDLNIILETAREYGIPLPSAAVDAQLYNAMLQNGMGGWITRR